MARSAEPVELGGHAIGARLYAEDSQTLMPSTGVLRTFQPPRLFGVRVETGYQQGQEVSPFYDALLAKIIAKGSTREQAIGRAIVAHSLYDSGCANQCWVAASRAAGFGFFARRYRHRHGRQNLARRPTNSPPSEKSRCDAIFPGREK